MPLQQNHKRKAAWSVLFLLLIAMGGLLIFQSEIPRWTVGGARTGISTPLAPVGNFPITIQNGSTIRWIGDSNMAGSRLQNAPSFVDLLSAQWGEAIEMEMRATGGATTRSFAKLGEAAPQHSLSIIMLGSNDAAPRAWLAKRRPIPLTEYRENLTALIVRSQHNHGAVLVLAAPPAGSEAMEARIAPYRDVAREVALDTESHFLDTAEPLSNANAHGALLHYDALHLNDKAHIALAEWVGAHLNSADGQ